MIPELIFIFAAVFSPVEARPALEATSPKIIEKTWRVKHHDTPRPGEASTPETVTPEVYGPGTWTLVNHYTNPVTRTYHSPDEPYPVGEYELFYEDWEDGTLYLHAFEYNSDFYHFLVDEVGVPKEQLTGD